MKLDTLRNLVFVHTNDEVKAFLSVLTPLLKAACANAGLPRIDHGVVIDNTAIKFATGKIKYDPARGKESTYVYRIAFNEAVDYYREFFKRNAGWEDGAKEALPDPNEDAPKSARLDTQTVVAEALRRLYTSERDCSQEALEIIVRYVILGEQREDLARIYGRTPDNISLVKTRLLPKLQRHFREAMREDWRGTLRLSSISLDFLKPFLPWI